MPSLRALLELADVYGVVTQPDRPAGRGKKLRATPVKAAAMELGLRVFEPLKLGEFTKSIAAQPWDVFALAAYGRILPKPLLDLPAIGALNVHPSLLPKYRGATPIQAALAAGDTVTGVTVMLMDAGMDTGDVVLQEPVEIGASENYGELHDRLAQIGGRLLLDALILAQTGNLTMQPQHGAASVTRPIAKSDLTIDWNWDARRIVNHVRAYSPQPAARATLDRETLKILRAHVLGGTGALQAGEIDQTRADALVVGCNGGAVVLDEIVLPNRSREPGIALLARRPRRNQA